MFRQQTDLMLFQKLKNLTNPLTEIEFGSFKKKRRRKDSWRDSGVMNLRKDLVSQRFLVFRIASVIISLGHFMDFMSRIKIMKENLMSEFWREL